MFDKLLRAVPDFKGKRRLANFMFSNTIRTKANLVVEGKYECTYLLPNLLDNISLDIFVNGIYEEETVDLLKKLIPQNGQYLDLGTNIGAILLPLCKQRPDIRVVGVEAAPWIFKFLEKNIAANKLQQVNIVNKALFDQDGLTIDFFSPADKFGKGSLSPVFSDKGVKVETVKVDSLIAAMNMNKVNAIKVDVEGFEYFVFRGAEQLLLSDAKPHIIFEFVDWAERQAKGLEAGAAQRYLRTLGFDLYVLEGSRPVKIENILTEGSYNLLASISWH